MALASWALKWGRAEQHVRELQDMVAPFTGWQHMKVTDEQRGEDWVYRVWVSEMIEQSWAVVAGEALFNVRSGLDHLAAVLCGGKNPKSSFPIFEMDPFTNTSWRGNWERATKGMSDEVVAALHELQPYAQPIQQREHHPAGILHRLQNADKHNELCLLAGGIRDVQVTFTLEDGTRTQPQQMNESGKVLRSGGVVASSTRLLPMQAEGNVVVLLGSPRDSWAYPFPLVFDEMFSWLGEAVVAKLDPFLPPAFRLAAWLE